MLLSAIEGTLLAAGVARRGEDRLVVACSGGADSVALAHATAELYGARRVILGHVDHQVRAGSSADAAFVSALAAELGAEARVEILPPGTDDEARLRTERYAALEAMRVAAEASWILTAHSADDQAETVLMGLIRSARLPALRGISPEHGRILRPLLGVSRTELRHYAARHRLAWREDPTNLEPRWVRNRVRKELLPLIERVYRPGFALRLAALATDVQALLTKMPSRPVVPDGRSPGAVAEDRSEAEASNSSAEARVVGGEAPAIRIERRSWTGGSLPDGKQRAIFDAALLDSPMLRQARPGDRIQPYGMRGTKKLQDVFVDAKVPRADRTCVWVVTNSKGEVVWVPRLVRSSSAAISEATREVWIFTCEDATLEDGS